jgi:hypothetical protein
MDRDIERSLDRIPNRPLDEMIRRFVLVRYSDASGLSGTGFVAYGACFWDGSAVLHWDSSYTSWATYSSMDTVQSLHGHNGLTKVEWIDE